MSKGILVIGFFALVSCTKDRFQPVAPGGIPGQESTIHFWDFNSPNGVNVSNPVITVGDAQITYSGEWDYADGTSLNGMQGTIPGSALRLRNPAGTCIAKISTLGFEKLKMSYAAMRTSNGAQENRISYSIDGVNFFHNGVTPSTATIGLEFDLKEFDFSSINALNNQPQVFIKIDFSLGHDNPTGNNRFDNLLFSATNL